MFETSAIMKAATSIRDWFSMLRQEQKQRSEQERRAIKALYVALNETLVYFRRLDRPYLAHSKKDRPMFERNVETEDAISRLWMEAAVELRDVNRELAERCFLKGQYWADRDRWGDNDIDAANIRLSRLIEDARALIRR